MKIRKILQKTPEDPEYHFFCPGCKCSHWFKTTGTSPRWTWNNNADRPQVFPSILVFPGGEKQCHLFIVDGYIKYLDDCWHQLRGKLVKMEDF